MEFSRPEYWSALLFPSAGDLPDPEIKGRSTSAADSLPLSHQGSPSSYYSLHNTLQMTDTEVLSTVRIFPPSLSWIASSTLNIRCVMTHSHLKFVTGGYLLFISTHQSLLTRDFSGFSQSILQGCLYVHELCCRQYSHSRAFSSENTSFATHLVLFQLCSGRPQKIWHLWNSDSLFSGSLIYLLLHQRAGLPWWFRW